MHCENISWVSQVWVIFKLEISIVCNFAQLRNIDFRDVVRVEPKPERFIVSRELQPEKMPF